ncbi:unnamed protein product [Darwinula stevensoni]|uniref:Uncharacterized protein n=1 Tax=Darwinula stevensoni TaxID=69355 RepID=A0A7R9A3J2_9CRUS|nr:unnamed protein product [Darwinula stevensoni]CAG0881395.1 unnamed protein product [Darwinula stevensoni]
MRFSEEKIIMEDVIDPFDSLDAMIKQEDLQKFVLFKTHYRKYMEVYLAYEELLCKLGECEEELEALRAADREAGEELEFIRCQLREREDDIFASDEKVTQLECELEEERAYACCLQEQLDRAKEEKESLLTENRTLRHEKNELNLRCQLLKSKSSDDTMTRSAERRRLQKGLEDLTRERDEWKSQWMDLREKVKGMEEMWRGSPGEGFRAVVRAGIGHLTSCPRSRSQCRFCNRVWSQSHLSSSSDSSSPASMDSDAKERLSGWLSTTYKALCQAMTELASDPEVQVQTPSPCDSSSHSDSSKDDSGFEDKLEEEPPQPETLSVPKPILRPTSKPEESEAKEPKPKTRRRWSMGSSKKTSHSQMHRIPFGEPLPRCPLVQHETDLDLGDTSSDEGCPAPKPPMPSTEAKEEENVEKGGFGSMRRLLHRMSARMKKRKKRPEK